MASPTLADQLRRLLEQFPEAKWHAYEAVSRDAIRAGTRLAFGEELEPVHHLEKADVIVSLEADFLAWGPGRLKDARAFAARRDALDGGAAGLDEPALCRRSTPSLTGAAADHRLAMPSRDVAALARALAAAIEPGDRGACQRVGDLPGRPGGTCRLDQARRARSDGEPRQEPGHRG